jgi:ribosome-associated toxin RatA of RatAB toxin-antitoxin module
MFSFQNPSLIADQLLERTIPVDNLKLVYCLVANVERYQEFVPGWIDAKRSALEFDGEKICHTTEQTVGLPGVLFARKTFSTHTTLEPYSKITVLAEDKSFRLTWTFEKTNSSNRETGQTGCTIIRCKSELATNNPLVRLLQTTHLETTVLAFEREALRRIRTEDPSSCEQLTAFLQ